MQIRLIDLRARDVVNVTTGARLGGICDAIVDAESGSIAAVIVPGPCRFFGLFGRGDDYVIPWNCIRKIGNDVLLCEVAGEYRREKPPRRFLF